MIQGEANNLKKILLDAINGVKIGSIDLSTANTLSASVRTYLQIINAQLAICEFANIEVPSELIEFTADNKKIIDIKKQKKPRLK